MKFVEALINAPIYTLMLLCGCVLLVLAFVTRLPWRLELVANRWRTRTLGVSGGVLLLAGLFLGIEMSRVRAQAAVPSHPPDREGSAPRPPVQGPHSGVLPTAEVSPEKTIYSEPATRQEWGCEDDQKATATLEVPRGYSFVAGEVEFLELTAAKSYRVGPVTFDPATRAVAATVFFRGLDRVFFNCPGGGHSRFRLKVVIRRER